MSISRRMDKEEVVYIHSGIILSHKKEKKKKAKSPITPALLKILVDLQCCVNFCCTAK